MDKFETNYQLFPFSLYLTLLLTIYKHVHVNVVIKYLVRF